MILYLILIPVIYVSLKLLLFFIIKIWGKISYKDFSAMGFSYDSKNDLFYATKNAWQKNFGYTRLYDLFAPLFSMTIDTEPVKFNYNNKNYLLCFWKGQYGITTGAEIGIYVTKDKEINKNTLYLPVSDEENMEMSFVLLKNNQEIMRRSESHWWLAIFKLGMYSKPKELMMDIKLKFPNTEMLEAFLDSFKKIGYKDKHYKVVNNTFIFRFKKPKTKKVWTRCFLIDKIASHNNKRNVKLYNKYIRDIISDNNDEKVITLQNLIPDVLQNKNNYDEILKKYGIFLDDDVYSDLRALNVSIR